MSNPLSDARFVRLLDERLRDVAEAKYNDLPSYIPTFYNVSDSQSAWEEFFEVGSVPDIREFDGQLQYLSVHPGFHLRVEHKEYAGGVHIQRKLIDDKKYGVLDNMAAGLGESAARVAEKRGSRLFTQAFSTAFDYMTDERAEALCADSHLSGKGGSATQDNKGTSALSKTSAAAAWLAMRRFQNDIGERINVSDNFYLVVPDALGDTADEIVGTPKSLDTGEGNINPQLRRYSVVRYLRLDDSDTTDWYLVNVDFMKRDVMWFWRIKPEFASTTDFDHLLVKSRVYTRFSYGWRDWRWIYGSSVS